MQILSDKGARVAGITTLAAAAFLVLSYASALAGDQGGGVKDQVGANYGYTSYSSEGAASTPCQSCYDGAGLAGTQNKTPYTMQAEPPCQTCKRGS